MKLPNGYGTVSKLSGKRRKPWRACLPATYELSETGSAKTVRPVLGYYRTRSEALQALAEFHKDPAVFSANTLSFEKLYEFWSKEKYAKADIGVIKPYTYAFRRCEDLYDKKIGQLTTDMLQNTIDVKAPTYANKKSLRNLFTQMFRYAIRHEFTVKNPALFLDIGKYERKVQRRLFTPEEIQKLWELAGTDSKADALLILIYTGLRCGELYNMKVADIDLDEKFMVGGSKTEAGRNRVIPIADKILPLIKKAYNPEAVTLMGDGVQYLTFRARLVSYAKSLGMIHTPHDTRYTFVSMMDSAGVPLLTTQKIIGHATGILTQDIYTKRHTQELIDAVNKL